MLARAIVRLPKAIRVVRCDKRSTYWPVWKAALGKCRGLGDETIFTHTSVDRVRHASSSSSTRWKSRQANDLYTREAKVAGLKSRAAFKLLEIDDKYRIFNRGDTVIDLGYAPGSWSEVAVSKTQPGGRVVGIDIIPAQPPRGVSTLQGDFLSPEIRQQVKIFVQDPSRGRARRPGLVGNGEESTMEDELEEESQSLTEREGKLDGGNGGASEEGRVGVGTPKEGTSQSELDVVEGRVVDVVLSDMSEPWPQTASTWIRSISNPYRRMMNTSGMGYRDHANSMNLCDAALTFCYDTLITGGHFVCKFYQGAEDKDLEMRLKKLFEKVQRVKPDSSRKESKEAYFVGLRRRAGVARGDVLGEGG